MEQRARRLSGTENLARRLGPLKMRNERDYSATVKVSSGQQDAVRGGEAVREKAVDYEDCIWMTVETVEQEKDSSRNYPRSLREGR